MPIDFSPTRWDRIRSDSAQWWTGDLDRPLILATAPGRDPGREPARHPYHFYTAFYDESVSAEEIVDAWDHELCSRELLGDSFPHVWLNFGPGVVAEFLGARLETNPDADTVWFHPPGDLEIDELQLKHDPANPWLLRIRDIARAATERWQGSVQVGMSDLGGPLDVLSSFRPGTGLLLDVMDDPDEIKRCARDIQTGWWQAFDEIDAELRPGNPGFTAWPGFFSAESHYMLQCDFAYMISPEQFDDLVLPTLSADCARLKNAFYHLDGPGQLNHLDSLLAIPELKGIQWIPGAGQPDMSQWPEVYQKIHAAGKLIQSFGPPHVLRAIAEQIGTAKGILHIGTVGEDGSRQEWDTLLNEFSANPAIQDQ